MICPKCGFKNDDNAYFCEGCGNRLNENNNINNAQTENRNIGFDNDNFNFGYNSNLNNEFENNSNFNYGNNQSENIVYYNPHNNGIKPPKKNNTLLVAIIIVSIIVVISAGVCVFLLFFNDKDDNFITQETTTVAETTNTESTTQETTYATLDNSSNKVMPDLYQRHMGTAIEKLQEENIKYKIEYRDDDFYKDYVIEQFPSAGEVVNNNQTVTIYVSRGEPEEENDQINDDYIIPDSNIDYISRSDLYGMSKEELTLALNEIYARYGLMFNTKSIKKYFNSKDWYVPSIKPGKFDDSVFNDYERKNIDTIVKYMEEKGYR